MAAFNDTKLVTSMAAEGKTYKLHAMLMYFGQHYHRWTPTSAKARHGSGLTTTALASSAKKALPSSSCPVG